MKIQIFLVLFLFFSFSGQAQQAHKNTLFASGGFCFGNYSGTNIALIYQHNEKISFQIENNILSRITQDPPVNLKVPKKRLAKELNKSFGFLVGFIHLIDNKKHYKFNLKAGIEYSLLDLPYNWQYVEHNILGSLFPKVFSSYYTNDYHRTQHIGITLEPSLELPLKKGIGIALSLYVNAHKKAVAFGIKSNIIIGRLY